MLHITFKRCSSINNEWIKRFFQLSQFDSTQVCDGSSLQAGKSSQQVDQERTKSSGWFLSVAVLWHCQLGDNKSIWTIKTVIQDFKALYKCCIIIITTLHPFNGLFSRTTWVGRHQKGKPFWILLEHEMMGQQWHQLDHMHIICTSLQTDNHASTSPLKFLQARCPSCRPTNSVRALKNCYNYR